MASLLYWSIGGKRLREMSDMEFATLSDETEILELYRAVIEQVNQTEVRLGWDIDTYPDAAFIDRAVSDSEMCIIRDDGKIVAAAVVNHSVNKEYDDINWKIKGPKDKLATIHALAVLLEKQGGKTGSRMLAGIEDYCRKNKDLAIHLDVIDTNIPAYKLYTRNGYDEVDRIRMFYDVVGTREFWMMERVLI